MKNILIIILSFLCLSSCGEKVSSAAAPQLQAVEIAQNSTPEKAASLMIDWLINADTAQRKFSRNLSVNILLYYDTIGSPDSARRFVAAFDSISERLSASKRAKILLALNSPSKTAAIVARQKSDEQLINEIKSLLQGNQVQLELFNTSLEEAQKQINLLENENSESIRSDD